jgi:hypothetical protein
MYPAASLAFERQKRCHNVTSYNPCLSPLVIVATRNVPLPRREPTSPTPARARVADIDPNAPIERVDPEVMRLFLIPTTSLVPFDPTNGRLHTIAVTVTGSFRSDHPVELTLTITVSINSGERIIELTPEVTSVTNNVGVNTFGFTSTLPGVQLHPTDDLTFYLSVVGNSPITSLILTSLSGTLTLAIDT